MRWLRFAGLCASCVLWSVSQAGAISETDAAFRKQLQLRLIQAQPGEVIEIPAGKWQLNRGLSLNKSGVTLRGAGPDKTILSFAAQSFGAEGLLINAATGVTIENLAIEDPKGDGLKANGCKDIVIRNVRVEWTRGPDEKNGAYGLYPVQSERVLIEHSVAIGASEAGIYAGQSRAVVIRKNRVAFNVAGMEIENSSDVDVHDNEVIDNAGGILVFNVPDVPVKDGRRVRVFDNRIRANNTRNFARPGLIFTVPSGTGLMVMANSEVEVSGNTFEDNATTHALIISFMATGKPQNDSGFDPYPQSLWIHHNDFVGGGNAPDMHALKALRIAALAQKGRLPDVLWDGVTPRKQDAAQMQICLRDNGGATFMNFDWRGRFDQPSTDLAPHDCELPSLPPVSWPDLAASAGS
jgi:parallel beta-helix repeat protein